MRGVGRELARKGGRARAGPMERCAIDWGSSPDTSARISAKKIGGVEAPVVAVMQVGRQVARVRRVGGIHHV